MQKINQFTITHKGVKLTGTYDQLCLFVPKEQLDAYLNNTNYHFSESLNQWIPMADMSTTHLHNAIMKALENNFDALTKELRSEIARGIGTINFSSKFSHLLSTFLDKGELPKLAKEMYNRSSL